jgi:hypothetical protein
MSEQSLFQEFSRVATIDTVDNILMVHTQDIYALGIKIKQGICIFINGKEVTSSELHKMLGV